MESREGYPYATDRDMNLYLHVPFCRRRCHYCDYSIWTDQESLIPAYLAAMGREMSLRSASVFRPALSLMVGGGNPGIIGPDGLDFLITAFKRNYRFQEDAEFSLEINPEDASPELVRTALRLGFNRVNLGIQTMNPYILEMLGRDHTLQQAREAFINFSGLGFRNISVDLLYGLPAQRASDLERDLREVISWGVTHVTLLELTVVPQSAFHEIYRARELALPFEDEADRMYLSGMTILKEAGFQHYEIASFALPGFKSMYQESIWRLGSCVGIGAGAHTHHDGTRFHNEPIPSEYTRLLNTGGDTRSLIRGLVKMSPSRRQRDALILGLRRTGGIDIERFDELYEIGVLQRYHREIQGLCQAGLLEIDNGRIRLSEKGLVYSGAVFREFL